MRVPNGVRPPRRASVSTSQETLRGSGAVLSAGMRYRVTFMERTNGSANPSEIPTEYLEIDLADGVVLDHTFVERTEPAAMHSEEALEEDDDFLSVGSETWDYDVADGRESDFMAAIQNSQMVIECVPLDEETPAV